MAAKQWSVFDNPKKKRKSDMISVGQPKSNNI